MRRVLEDHDQNNRTILLIYYIAIVLDNSVKIQFDPTLIGSNLKNHFQGFHYPIDTYQVNKNLLKKYTFRMRAVENNVSEMYDFFVTRS